MIASLALLSKSDLDALSRELTCFVLPVSGLEEHGPHLPLGTKQLIAEEWAQALVKKLSSQMPHWNFILLPLIPLTVDTVTSEWALPVRPHVVRDAIVDQFEELKKRGFLNFLVITGHPTSRNLTAIEDACKMVSRRSLLGFRRGATCISVTSSQIQFSEVVRSPWIAIPREHAGRFETGMVLKVNPQWVKPQYLELPSVQQPKATGARWLNYFFSKVSGYWGAPAQASAEAAQQELDSRVSMGAEQIKNTLETGRGRSIFFAAYRWYPMNGSFFKAYFLASIFFLIMLLWAIHSIRTMVDH